MLIENRYAKLWISGGILFFIYKPVDEINLDAAEKIVQTRLQLQNEKAYPIFCDLRLIGHTYKAARDYLAQEGSYMAKAVAYLVLEPYSTAMICLYLKASKPNIPSQFFTHKEDALEFLSHYR